MGKNGNMVLTTEKKCDIIEKKTEIWKMERNPNFRNLAFLGIVLAMMAVVFITDIVCGNIIGSAICMALIVLLCFVLGYIYSQFEKWNLDNGVSSKLFERKPKEEIVAAEIPTNISIDDLIEMAENAESEEPI